MVVKMKIKINFDNQIEPSFLTRVGEVEKISK